MSRIQWTFSGDWCVVQRTCSGVWNNELVEECGTVDL